MADDKEHEDDKSTENTPETEENDEEMVNGDEDDSEFDDREGFVDDISDEEVSEVLLSGGGHGDGLLSANYLENRLEPLSKAVCLIEVTIKVKDSNQNKFRHGTGFYTNIPIRDVTFDVIFTNNHVLENEQDAEMAVAVFGYNDNKQGKKILLKPVVIFRTNKELDYSFVGVQKEDIQALNLGISPIKFLSEPKICQGDEIYILQHPRGRPKEFSHDKVLSVEAPFVKYKADTESGSSGAPVFLNGNLVAIHQKGSEKFGYNKGVLCSEVLSHLKTGKYTTPKRDIASDIQEKKIDEEFNKVTTPKRDIASDSQEKKIDEEFNKEMTSKVQ